MLEQAADDLDLDPDGSLMVGDHGSDIGFGKNGGMQAVFVTTGHGDVEWARHESWPWQPDHVCPSIAEAAEWILGELEK